MLRARLPTTTCLKSPPYPRPSDRVEEPADWRDLLEEVDAENLKKSARRLH